MESQSDIEVILDFLEECYRQSAPGDSTFLPVGAESALWWPGGLEGSCAWENAESAMPLPLSMALELESSSLISSIKSVAPDFQLDFPQDDAAPTRVPDEDALWGHRPAAGLVPASTLCDQQAGPRARRSTAGAGGGGAGKVRLYHFLFEMLQDPGMAHCVCWEPAGVAGVFRFSSANKDAVAALWGRRKGNRKTMTYQKMARALRNYSRSGEIMKVKRKLTYQFSTDTLRSLQGPQRPAGGPHGACIATLCSTSGTALPSG